MAVRHRGAQVTLYSENASISARVVRQLRRRKVDYRPGMPVTAIEPGPLVITGLARQEFDCVCSRPAPRRYRGCGSRG